MSTDTASQMVEKFAEELLEHVDSVIVIATVYDGSGEPGGSGTRVICKHRGNYYATKGVITEWLEEERNRDLAEKLHPEEE